MINIKVRKQKKDVGMACQKVCKQGRDNIKMKVNIQSSIPTVFTFHITVVL